MAFKKGKPKTGGREKGDENKITQDSKEIFRLISVEHILFCLTIC